MKTYVKANKKIYYLLKTATKARKKYAILSRLFVSFYGFD